ncbi:MAG: hypothetical protein ABIQ17_03040 [Candidatus Limnocylindrales bacterium]
MTDLRTGADKPFEADDPLSFVPVRFPVESSEEADRDQARCLVEEYALIGWSADRIRELFHAPQYAATYGIFRRRGSAFVDAAIDAVLGRNGGA